MHPARRSPSFIACATAAWLWCGSATAQPVDAAEPPADDSKAASDTPPGDDGDDTDVAPANDATPDGDDGAAANDRDPDDRDTDGGDASATDTPAPPDNDNNRAAGKPHPAAAATRDKPVTDAEVDAPHVGHFAFGTYGRVVAAGDLRGRPARNADIVAYGSRLDHQSYVELELRREDHWEDLDIDTKMVATLALAHPVFHYNGEFDGSIAVRNLYLEARDLGTEGFQLWAGSRMLRGDDIYLLDFWPLDNLNTFGGGAIYDLPTDTQLSLHMGLSQPNNPFYRQQGQRAVPLNQFGAATVAILDRQQWTGSLRAQQLIPIGEKSGIKLVGYGELHQVPEGQRETAEAGVFEDVPHDSGYVVGAQLTGYTGERDTHINLYVRYASGIAAYGAFANPQGLGADGSATDASELLVAAGGNAEFGPVAVMLAAYFRSFRNASASLDFGDVDEGIVMVRPQVWLLDWLGFGVEASYQAQTRGVITSDANEEDEIAPKPLTARVARLGFMPFVTPAGRGSYSRPNFYFIYNASFRDAGTRALYPTDDPFATRSTEHFLGFGAEWWFGSTSYAR